MSTPHPLCIEDIERLTETIKQIQYQHGMLLNWVSVAVIKFDVDGNITDVNDEALRTLGWEREELIGSHGHSQLHHTLDDGGEYPWEFCPVFAALEDGSSHHVDGDVFWRKDGSSFSADFIVCAVRDEFQTIIGAVLTFRNVTDQKIQEAKRLHDLKLQSIGELSAGIAHEINTPIQFIGSNIAFLQEGFKDLLQLIEGQHKLLELVKEQGLFEDLVKELEELEEDADVEYLEEEVPKALDQTFHGVQRVTELVQGLKGFSRFGEETKHATNLNEVIANTLIVCKNEYKYVADLQTKLEEIPDVEVYQGDIGQVILNLVVNAAHAIGDMKEKTGENGVILVSSHQEGDQIQISVSDTGCGINPKIGERIFDPFFTTKEVGKGSGQGLALARTIVVEKHGGELSFTSEPGKGSTFTMTLPIFKPK